MYGACGVLGGGKEEGGGVLGAANPSRLGWKSTHYLTAGRVHPAVSTRSSMPRCSKGVMEVHAGVDGARGIIGGPSSTHSI